MEENLEFRMDFERSIIKVGVNNLVFTYTPVTIFTSKDNIGTE